MKCVNSIGFNILRNAPHIPDYVQKQSLGLAYSYVQICLHITNLIATSFLLWLSEKVKLSYIYFGIAAMDFITAIFLYWGLYDVVKDKKVKSNNVAQTDELAGGENVE